MTDEGRNQPPFGEDNRQYQRRPVVRFIWYKLLEDDNETSEYNSEGISKTCDISSSGIGIYVTTELPLGKLIFIEVAAHEFGISAVGKITNVRPSAKKYFRVGIHFTIVPPNDRLKLGEFLGSHGKDKP
jgi:hypothetical protein